mmetsp:Transcript_180280/g.572187  ORF Transcript_180280/g.572187 Transcript_180280/m.572187 type:complete len:217 (-) Transcript_180280:726-1376(-)
MRSSSLASCARPSPSELPIRPPRTRRLEEEGRRHSRCTTTEAWNGATTSRGGRAVDEADGPQPAVSLNSCASSVHSASKASPVLGPRYVAVGRADSDKTPGTGEVEHADGAPSLLAGHKCSDQNPQSSSAVNADVEGWGSAEALQCMESVLDVAAASVGSLRNVGAAPPTPGPAAPAPAAPEALSPGARSTPAQPLRGSAPPALSSSSAARAIAWW